MPVIGLFAYDFDTMISPVMQEINYAFIPRIGDYVHRPNPRGGSSVYEVFAVVVQLEDEREKLVADVHAKQVSPEMTPAGSHIANLLGLNKFYPSGPEPKQSS